MLKGLLAAISLCLGACNNAPIEASSEPVIDATTPPTPTFILGYIVQIYCTNLVDGKQTGGTAFYIGNGQFLTADHVAEEQTVCTDVAGVIMPVSVRDKTKDIALIQMPSLEGEEWPEKGMRIGCEPFKAGKEYYAIGYAGGVAFMMNKLVANKTYTKGDFLVGNDHRPGMKEFHGLLIQGMSGGPITDPNGYVIGLNNVTAGSGTLAYSYELADTFICKG